MAENDIIVPKENASGGFDEVALTAADIAAAEETHASSHATGGSDPITPSDIGAATTESTVAAAKALADEYTGNPALIYTSEGSNGWTTLSEPASFRNALELGTAATADSTDFAPAVNVIELTPNGTTTITTSQLPARGIAYIEGGGSFTVNLPTPDKRQSGLTFSIKVEHEGASGDVFITVVHNASDLLTGYELDEDESSLDFLWDGYRWTYSSANWLYSYPNRRLAIPPLSGTLGLSEPADNVFRVVGSADATKKLAFEVDGLTTATTRTLSVPNASGTIALTSQAADMEITDNTKGVILKSPNNTRYRLTVSNSGLPIFTALLLMLLISLAPAQNIGMATDTNSNILTDRTNTLTFTNPVAWATNVVAQTRTNLFTSGLVPSGAAATNSVLTADGSGGSAFVASRTQVATLNSNIVRIDWPYNVANQFLNRIISVSLDANSIYRISYVAKYGQTNASVTLAHELRTDGGIAVVTHRAGWGQSPNTALLSIAFSGATNATSIPLPSVGALSNSIVLVAGETYVNTASNSVKLYYQWTTPTNTSNAATLYEGTTLTAEKIYP